LNNTLESFAAVSQRYRGLCFVARVCVGAFMLTCVIGVAARIISPALTHVALVLWLAGVSAMIAANVCLKCTGCGGHLASRKGAHCPGCGSRLLSEPGWLDPRQCLACGLELRFGRGGRSFTVHYCGHCGAHLDERGV